MATTIYIIFTVVIFSINLLANIFALSIKRSNKFPTAEFISMVLAIIFVVWGITLIVTT